MLALVSVVVGILLLGLYVLNNTAPRAGLYLPAMPKLDNTTQEMVLAELEAAAPHLFQLRKVGLFLPASPELQQQLRQVDPVRAQRIIQLLDGKVAL